MCAGCGGPLPPQKAGRPRKWCSERCRKQTMYGGTCRFCGATTNGYDGPGTASDVCKVCLYTRLAWNREKVIAAIQRWADEHGGIPPTSVDWGNASGRPDRRHLDYTPEYPSCETVREHCGSFTDAIRAAGFEPVWTCTTEPFDVIYAKALAGRSAAELAEEYGVTPAAIYLRFRNHGVPFRTLRAAA